MENQNNNSYQARQNWPDKKGYPGHPDTGDFLQIDKVKIGQTETGYSNYQISSSALGQLPYPQLFRYCFFENIASVAAFVGWHCSTILKPLLQQGRASILKLRQL